MDKAIEHEENATTPPDPLLEEAKSMARERMKLPPHLRGAPLLNETLK